MTSERRPTANETSMDLCQELVCMGEEYRTDWLCVLGTNVVVI